MSRRSVLAGGATMLAASVEGSHAVDGGPLRFGIVADPQFAEAPPHLGMNRYFANSLGKLREAVATFNRQPLHFVASLGDVIDRDWASFAPIMRVYDGLRHGKVFLLGNHDFSVDPHHLGAVAGRLGLERGYYDFLAQDVRFIVLDGNDVSVFAPPPGDPRRALAEERLAAAKAKGAPQAHPWNGSLSDEQFAWLEAALVKSRAAGERAVVMNHYPVFPAGPLTLWDSDRVVDLITAHPHVLAYLCGHDHAGGYGETGGVHFVTFAGMVDTEADNAFATVELHRDRLDIKGFGREPSRSLRLAQR